MHGRKVWNTAATERLLSAPSCFCFSTLSLLLFLLLTDSLALLGLFIHFSHTCLSDQSIHPHPHTHSLPWEYRLKGDRQSYPSWHMSHPFLPLPGYLSHFLLKNPLEGLQKGVFFRAQKHIYFALFVFLCFQRNSSAENENLLKLYLPSGHPRCRWVCFCIGKDLEKFSLLTNGSSAVNGCHHNESPNSW